MNEQTSSSHPPYYWLDGFSFFHMDTSVKPGFLVVCLNSVRLKQQQQFHKLYLKYLRTAALPGNEFICTICLVSIFHSIITS